MTTPVQAKPLEYSDSNYQPPHAPAGSPEGGQFTSTNGTASSNKRGTLTYSGKRQGTQRSGKGGGSAKAAAKNATTLKMGKDNDPEAVKQLQALISELGLANVAIDGVIGPHTDAAIKAIQTKLGMKPTGSATPALVRRLKDAHTLSPCVDKGASQVTASAAYDEEDFDEDELEDEDLDDEEDDGDDEPEFVTAAAGHDVTPGHDELHHWWVLGEGRHRWHTWTELRDQLAEHVGPIKAAIYASAWFHERYGFWSGSDLNRVKNGKPPRGSRVGPG